MSVDVERVCEGAESLHEIWACLASVGLTIAIVYQQVSQIAPCLWHIV